MSIGQVYSDWLTPREQQALQVGCDWLIDHAFDELEAVKDPKDIVNTVMGGHLPERYLYKYTQLFFRKFAVCLITVTWKLAQPEHMPLSSLAEELAAWAIIMEARRVIEEDRGEEEAEKAFDAFIDGYFEDTDFLYLFENASDGIDESQVAQMMGMSSLAFADWFLPFSDEPSRRAHPYVL